MAEQISSVVPKVLWSTFPRMTKNITGRVGGASFIWDALKPELLRLSCRRITPDRYQQQAVTEESIHFLKCKRKKSPKLQKAEATQLIPLQVSLNYTLSNRVWTLLLVEFLQRLYSKMNAIQSISNTYAHKSKTDFICCCVQFPILQT